MPVFQWVFFEKRKSKHNEFIMYRNDNTIHNVNKINIKKLNEM